MNKYKNAFSLAEVLITMVVIGIITALITPVLLEKTNKQETIVKVKKVQEFLSDAINKYSVDNNCVNNLSKCSAFSGNANPTLAWNAFKPYLNTLKDCGITTASGCFSTGIVYKRINSSLSGQLLDSTSFYKVIISNSMLFALSDGTGNCSVSRSISGNTALANTCADVKIDINGTNGPNQWGRDLFEWRILKDGTVVPTGSNDDTWKGCDPTSTDETGDSSGAPGTGVGCAAKILQENAVNY